MIREQGHFLTRMATLAKDVMIQDDDDDDDMGRFQIESCIQSTREREREKGVLIHRPAETEEKGPSFREVKLFQCLWTKCTSISSFLDFQGWAFFVLLLSWWMT